MLIENPRPFLQNPGDAQRMVQLMTAPVNKVGLVLVRNAHSADPEICLVQVKAKNVAEQHKVDFGLAKGTRQYLDKATNQWCDARDFMAAVHHKDTLEPLRETLYKESYEEIGLDRHDFDRATILELGSRLFAPRSGATPFDIQWYAIEADDAMIGRMNPNPPDAHAVKWVKLTDIAAMMDSGTINKGYAHIIVETIDKLRGHELKPASFEQGFLR